MNKEIIRLKRELARLEVKQYRIRKEIETIQDRCPHNNTSNWGMMFWLCNDCGYDDSSEWFGKKPLGGKKIAKPESSTTNPGIPG